MTQVTIIALLAVAVILAFGVIILSVLFMRHEEYKQSLAHAEKARQEMQERADRLIEAMARKADIDLMMPVPIPQDLEPASCWYGNKRTEPVSIVVPPIPGKEERQ